MGSEQQPKDSKEICSKMEKVDFTCKLETVDTKEVLVNLFKSADEQDGGEKDNLEFLLHLDAEIPDQGNKKVQEAEFIIVVDRSGSMQGTPWKQVQGALCKMLDLTRDQGNIRIRVISYNQDASQVALTGESQEVRQEDANMQRQPKVGTEDLREVDWSAKSN